MDISDKNERVEPLIFDYPDQKIVRVKYGAALKKGNYRKTQEDRVRLTLIFSIWPTIVLMRKVITPYSQFLMDTLVTGHQNSARKVLFQNFKTILISSNKIALKLCEKVRICLNFSLFRNRFRVLS